MNVTRYAALPALAISLLATAAAGQEGVKEYSIAIDRSESEYTINVGGTMDPENLEITIENLGDTPVVNPRVTVNGLYDWYDAKSLAAEITRGCNTDEEKALAIWSWIRYRTYQRSPQNDDSATNPVRALNGYGYGICGHVAAWMKCLWTAAGVPGRVQELAGHTVSEAYYNGAWHELDGNVKVFYLDHDNRTIASLATVEHDASLIQRTIHPREMEPWFIGPDTPERNEEFVHYITSYKDNYEEHSYDGVIAKDYNMAMTLKPGEKLVRWWTPRLGKFEGRGGRAEVPQIYANGQLIWEPDLARVDIRPYLWVPEHHYPNIATRTQDGQGPAIHVGDLQDSLYPNPARFAIPIASPYPIVGGRFTCTLVKEGGSSLDTASIFFGEPGWGSGDLYEYRWGSGAQKVGLDLDSKLLRSHSTYGYSIGFGIGANADDKPATQTGLDAFRSETDLQVAPESLPALSLGTNTVRFRQQSSAKVRITYRWREINGPRLPGKVQAPASPGNGGEVSSLAPLLQWAPAEQVAGSDKVVDYQVMVSLRPDCRWPLSTTLQQNVGSAKTAWKVPAGFLNPGSTYYWKVRARNGRGDVGEWGTVFSFKTAAGAR
ncbi:MAG: transglutaminase domain-containing protein [Terriglobia bacterium]